MRILHWLQERARFGLLLSGLGWMYLLYAFLLSKAGGAVGIMYMLPCPLLALTGLHCPLCGLTRSLNASLNGDHQAAVAFHPAGAFLLPVLLVILCAVPVFTTAALLFRPRDAIDQ